MRRLIHSAAALLTALFALLLCAGAVQSGAVTDRNERDPARGALDPQAAPLASLASLVIDSQKAESPFLPTTEFSVTRIVTVTVYTSTVPQAPALNSHWQIALFSQVAFPPSSFRLPSDASAISVTMFSGEYGIDYAGPIIYITNSQGLYYEYGTNQQAQRFGNEYVITQTYRYNRSLHYMGTLIFTDPYRYVGYTGYAPAQTSAAQLYWDQSFPDNVLNQFDAATWLVDPQALPRPDLEIITATVFNLNNHLHVSATIRNNDNFTSTGAPSFVNLYDRLSPSQPAGPLDLNNGWCTLTPVAWCGGISNSPLPSIAKNQTAVFTAESDLTAVDGQHYIYLFVDALGGSTLNAGLNWETNEINNSFLAGTVTRWANFVFLPVIQR